MDLSKLSTQDLLALKAGNLKMVSDDGLRLLKAASQQPVDSFKYDATDGMSGTDKFLAGAGKGMTDVVRGVGQLVGAVDQTAVDEAKSRDRALSETGAGMAGELVGNLALTMAPGVGLGGLATKGAAAVLPTIARAAAPTVGAALSGAAVSGAAPVASDESRAGNAVLGAAGGAIGDVAARGVSRIAQPIRQSAAVQRLLGEGVVPTPGQAAGGVVGRLEEKFQSLPGPGDIIRMGRDRAGTEFNAAALNKAVPAGQRTVTAIGQEGIDQAKTAISGAYDAALAGRVMQPDAALNTGLQAAKNASLLPLNSNRQKEFDSILRRHVWERIPQSGSLPAAAVKAEIDRDLGQLAFKLGKSNMAEEQALGEAVKAARDEVRNWMTRQTGTAAQRAAADTAHANKVALQKSVERAKAAGGKFTPYQLQATTRDGTDLRALANAGQEVLGSRVPNSGTADRAAALAALTLGAGGVGANEYFGGPAYVSALLMSPLLYSRAGSRYALGDLVPGQKAVAAAARRGAPYAAQAGRSLASLLDE
jgi:hypothetical protein